MKMENHRSLGKLPLPGDRQGMSGADAGHDSMRDVGGRVLRRRAPVTQSATAQPQPQQESYTPLTAPAAEDAAQEPQPALTQAGLPRQRIKWTVSMNEAILRIFYRVTQLGQEMTGYRQQLHAKFCTEYPNVRVTEQRVADQYRAILRNNLIPETRRDAIKQEIELSVNIDNNQQHENLLEPQRESYTLPRTPPSEREAQEPLPALTQAGLPRQRMRWTVSMNETILRIFYRVTQLGREMIGYRQQLHAEFCRIYPNLRVTEQRVADQYRAILKNNFISEERRNIIKREIERSIGTENNQEQEIGPDLLQADTNMNAESENMEQEPQGDQETQDENRQQENEELAEKLSIAMRRAVAEYDGSNPLTRPPLPRLRSSRKLASILDFLNKRILPGYISEATTLEQLHTIIYCSATAATRTLGLGIPVRSGANQTKAKPNMPNWERRLHGKIETLRKQIGQLTDYIGGVRTRTIQRKVDQIMKNSQHHAQYDPINNTPQRCLDTLKQKLYVYAGRLRRYKASNSRKQDNSLFQRAEKVFYRKLNSILEEDNNNYPTKTEIEQFWGNQLATPAVCNISASWVDEERQRCQGYNEMPHEPFTTEEIFNVIKDSQNWKSPGPDHVQNYWIKKLWSTHQQLTTLINDVILNPQKMPMFLTQGATLLLAKDRRNTQDPTKYRPITCLPTIYKVITSCLTQRIYEHCERNNIIAVQQKGCAKGAMGCKEQLVIDSVICNQAYKNKRNLFAAYVDYKKAFDSVPHEWLTGVLKLYKVDNHAITFLEHVMSTWRTRIELKTGTNSIKTDMIPIRKGIFQGDSLSPLWFCLAMNPLSSRLNSTKHGFGIRHNNTELQKLNHLLYMDDLKLMAATKHQMNQMLNIVEEFSTDIGMNFGLDKCRTLYITKGKIQSEAYETQNGQTIAGMDASETYKYLGIKQAQRIDHRTMKKELTNEFTKRVRQVVKTNLNSKNMFKAINTYACSALTYSFGIVNWSKTDIEGLQRKIRTLLTGAHKHHPRSAVERTTLPRHLGGRGLIDISKQLNQQVLNLRTYFHKKADTSILHRAICVADNSTPLRLCDQDYHIARYTDQQKLQKWIEKPLHGRHPNEVAQENVDNKASNYWLTSGQMFPETEGFLLAIQDQVIPTRNYQKFIIKDPLVRSDRCRYGCQTSESIQHVTGGCQAFAATEYKERHDTVAKILHQELAEKTKLLCTDRVPYYKYAPEPILENNNFKLYWDRTVLTDQHVRHNRPDIIIVDKTSRKATLIDVAIPNNNNLRIKHNEKIAKYRDLEFQIKRQWGMRSIQTIPIIVSTTGAIPKTLQENIKRLGINENIYKAMQRAVLLATARTVRKFMGNTEESDNLGPDNQERAPTELNPFDI